MTWHYSTFGPVTHVRVFVSGTKCGDLCFRTAEFDEIRANSPQVLFVEDVWTAQPEPEPCDKRWPAWPKLSDISMEAMA